MTGEKEGGTTDWATAAVLIVLILAVFASCHFDDFDRVGYPQGCECETEERSDQ